MPGLKSKFLRTICNNSFCDLVDVPKSKTVIDNGSATPIAYDTCTKQRRQRPALTKDLATQRAA